jgi:hypothetical protein
MKLSWKGYTLVGVSSLALCGLVWAVAGHSGEAASSAKQSAGKAGLGTVPSYLDAIPSAIPYAGSRTSERAQLCDGDEKLCTTMSTKSPDEAMKKLAELVKLDGMHRYKLQVRLVEDDELTLDEEVPKSAVAKPSASAAPNKTSNKE